MTFFAHSLPERPPAEWQTLAAHSNAVADLCASFAAPFASAASALLLNVFLNLVAPSTVTSATLPVPPDPN